MTELLKAPFPWFGGKSRVAHEVWDRFGNVPNYVEPFAGSLAVLLGRPHPPETETVNDLDCYLANFWRAVKDDPETVAAFTDAPVNEADLHARHVWLMAQTEFRERMKTDPHFYDAKIAGWWAWGLCSWIGQGWCMERRNGPTPQLPHLGTGMGLNRKLPHVQLSWLMGLSERLHRVRVACGSWNRIVGPAVTEQHGVTGIFLDPPYSGEHSIQYSANTDVAGEVRAWAVENGSNPLLRIALCGYEGEHEMPITWDVMAWKAVGGYGGHGHGQGRETAGRERIWFSPHCLRPQLSLFAQQEVTA